MSLLGSWRLEGLKLHRSSAVILLRLKSGYARRPKYGAADGKLSVSPLCLWIWCRASCRDDLMSVCKIVILGIFFIECQSFEFDSEIKSRMLDWRLEPLWLVKIDVTQTQFCILKPQWLLFIFFPPDSVSYQFQMTLVAFTPTLFGPNFQTFQFDPYQNDRCEISPGSSSQTLVQPKEVGMVQIKLNHGCSSCPVSKHFLKGSDFCTSDQNRKPMKLTVTQTNWCYCHDLFGSVLQSAGQRAIPADLCVDVFYRFKKIPILVLTLVYTLSVFGENEIIGLKLDCTISTLLSLADAVSKIVSPDLRITVLAWLLP